MKSNNRKNICVSLLTGLLLSSVFIQYADASNYTITQITNNDYDDFEPDISDDGKIVWVAPVGNAYPMQVSLYNGGSVQQLTNFTTENLRLARIGSNGHVAWLLSSDIHIGGLYGYESQIQFYDGISTQTIGHYVYPCCGTSFEEPDINASGNVVWIATDGNDWEIFLFNGATTTNLSNNNLSSDVDPVIANNGQVVWSAWDGNDWEVYLYDGSTTQQFTNNIGIQDALPHINASGQIAWVANWNDPVTTQLKSAVYFYDGVNTIKVDETGSGGPLHPSRAFSSVKISDNGKLLYLHPVSADSGDMRVYLYDNGSSIDISGTSTWASGLQVNANGQAVWNGYDGSDYSDSEIFVYDGNTTIQLTNNSDNDFWPRINNNGAIVWGQNSETGDTICDPFNPFGWCYPVFTDVEIFLASPNQAPSANSQSVTTQEYATVRITLTGSDPEGNSMTFSILTQPTDGILSGVAPNLTYTPTADYNGPDSFTFKVNDGLGDSNIATVSITVIPVNTPPVMGDIPDVSFEKNGSATLPGNASLDSYVSDVETSNASFIWAVSGGTNVTVTINMDRTVTFTATKNFSGQETLTFTTTDTGDGGSGPLSTSDTVVVIVTPTVNEPPALNPIGNQTVDEGATLNLSITATDPDSPALSFAVTGLPTFCAFTDNPNNTGTLICTPDYVDSGIYPNVTFSVSDNWLSDSKIITITVNDVPNNTPAGPDTVVSLSPDVSITFDNVDTSGMTTMTAIGGGTPPPYGFKVATLKGQTTYYDIDTTAAYTGNIQVCINYNPNIVAGKENKLALLQYNPGTNLWEDITVRPGYPDTNNHVICGKTTML